MRYLLPLLRRFIVLTLLLSCLLPAAYIALQGSVPLGSSVGSVGGYLGVPRADLEISYWELLSSGLRELRAAPPKTRQARLLFLALSLPLHPPLYTYIALYPESALARHAMPHPLIPAPITWRQAPGTWWRLVVEITWLGLTK